MASKDETRKVEIIMNGQKANASMKEMKAYAKLLWNQMEKLPATSQEFINKSKQFQKVSARIKGVHNEARGVNKGMGLLTGTVGKLFGAFGAYTVLNKVGQAWDYLTGKTKRFEKALDTLQSITGASAADMAFYSSEAKKMGKETTLSANQVADAYTLIGSKKPELLKNKEALVSVTKEAIALAEAAKIDLVPAADALTGILNQWGESAEESSRVINVLAAGSKYGAGNIEYLNDSMLRFGPTADAMNISIEQSAAVMEVFAEKGVISQKAGTQFRNILTTLAAGAKETNPEIVGLADAIENLGKQNLSTAELTEMFGKENLVGAQILVKSSERVKEFTEALTGTNVAYEQQRINNDNWEGDLKSLQSVQETLALNIGEHMLPMLRQWTQGMRNLLSIIADWFKTPTSEKLELERLKMNALVTSIEAQNEGSEMRNRLVQRLQEQYPDFLGNLNAETLTNEQLRDRLKEVNYEYQKKILHAQKEEELNDLMERRLMLAKQIDDWTIKIAQSDNGSIWLAENTKKDLRKSIEQNKELMAEVDTRAADLDEKWRRIGKIAGINFDEVSTKTSEATQAVVNSNTASVDSTEEAVKKQIDAQRRLGDLRIALIEDDYERERETTIAKYNRDIEDLDKQSETYLQEVVALEKLKRQELEDLRLKHEEEDRQRKEEEDQQKLEELEAEEEKKLLDVENKFINAVNAERELEEALFQIQREYAQKKIDQLTEMHGAESVEVARAKNDLLRLEQKHANDKIEQERQFQEAKRAMMYEGLEASREIFFAGALLLKKGSAAQKIAGKAYKAFTKGKIILDTQSEIRAIWKNYQSNPRNILFPGWGAAIAAIKTGAALGRMGVSLKHVNAQQFAKGGMTIPMVKIGETWEAAKHIGSFSRGGMYNGNNLGVIGERGPEWVAPNWMLQDPVTANIIGMLEAKRQQAGAYAVGGSTGTPSKQTAPISNLNNSGLEKLLLTNNEYQKQLVFLLQNLPANIKVWASIAELDEGLKLLQKLRDDASIGS